MTWPNLFIAAAPRTGSTQLFRWLGSHPDIGQSPIKEPNFFSAQDFDPAYVARAHLDDCDPTRLPKRPVQFAVVRREADYRALFAGLTQPWRLEASTTYLGCPDSAAAIRARIPDARILLLTRDPYERALSHYRLALRTGHSRRSLAEELDREEQGLTPPEARFLLRPSRQAAGVARFRAAFPAAQILELRFDEMTRAPEPVLTRIAAFLDIAPDGFDLSVRGTNKGVLPRFPRTNRALQQTGLKTLLRRVLPPAAKPVLKRLWFDADARLVIPQSDLDRLRRALASEP